MKVAIVGANGQVGAEVTLLLKEKPDIEVTPICRNRGGSAFLRYMGVACRHGSPGDPGQAEGLLSDCAVVANFALGGGSPTEAARDNDLLIENVIRFAAPGATVLHFSTLAVYGDATLGGPFRWRGAYGREKLRNERRALRFGRRFGKPVYILRLGHVCGALQNFTRAIKADIATTGGVIPFPERGSNTTDTTVIAEAILSAAVGILGPPGVYDLVNHPQWTWRELFVFEGAGDWGKRAVDVDLNSGASSQSGLVRRSVGRQLRNLTGNAVAREFMLRLASHLPISYNKRLQAIQYRQRCGDEIAALGARPLVSEALLWREIPGRTPPGLAATGELVGRVRRPLTEPDDQDRWPADLPMAGQQTSLRRLRVGLPG